MQAAGLLQQGAAHLQGGACAAAVKAHLALNPGESKGNELHPPRRVKALRRLEQAHHSGLEIILPLPAVGSHAEGIGPDQRRQLLEKRFSGLLLPLLEAPEQLPDLLLGHER